MAMTRKATPEKKPVGATRVSAKAPKKAVAGKPAAKKAVRKKPVKKPIPNKLSESSSSTNDLKLTAAEKKSLKEARDKKRASAEKAKATKAANMQRRIDGATRVDPTDEAGTALVAKANAPWQLAADRIPDADIIEPAPSPRIKRTAVDRVNDPPPATGIALVERVTRSVERELSQIEVIIGGNHVNKDRRTEAERRARTLASLARTLNELRRLRTDEDKLKPRDDDRPRDLDELRRTLSRRLDEMVRGRTQVPAGDDEAGGHGPPP